MAHAIAPLTVTEQSIHILDQRHLPTQHILQECFRGDQVVAAIKVLAVRGAPAIGISALYAMWLYAREFHNHSSFQLAMSDAAERLAHARPTAVNLRWAVRRALGVVSESSVDTIHQLRNLADQAHQEEIVINNRIAEYGRSLFSHSVTILTHCNTGSLATFGVGTALGVIRALHNHSKIDRVYVDETRPLLQGSRLTAWELQQEGIPSMLIADNMAGHVMKTQIVDAVIVGADRICLNGDTANKIGTYALAVLASYHQIPFYVAAPLSTFDPQMAHGDLIPIEERDADELRQYGTIPTAPHNTPVFNPAFDVTPGSLISGFITEHGLITPPYTDVLPRLFDKLAQNGGHSNA